MAEIRHLENRHDIIFFCRGWSDLDKISQTGAEWHVDCGGVVEIKTRCRIPIWRTFGRIRWHVIPQPRITLQGAATWWIHCHDFRATCHIAGCKNFIRHIENRFSPYFILFLFQCSLGFDERRLSYRLRYTCYTINATLVCVLSYNSIFLCAWWQTSVSDQRKILHDGTYRSPTCLLPFRPRYPKGSQNPKFRPSKKANVLQTISRSVSRQLELKISSTRAV